MFNLFKKGPEGEQPKQPVITIEKLVEERDTLSTELEGLQTEVGIEIGLLQLDGRSQEQKTAISTKIKELNQLIDQKSFALNKRVQEINKRGGAPKPQKEITAEDAAEIFERAASSKSVETGS